MDTRGYNQDAVVRGMRAVYDENRKMFYDMAGKLTDADLRQPSANGSFTIGELMFHMAHSLEYLPKEVAAARNRKNLNPMPKVIYDWVNVLYMRYHARRHTVASLKVKYEAAYQEALKLLSKIGPDEWVMTTRFFYIEANITELFRRQRQHHIEHLGQIQSSKLLR
jgi:hypothetical protein